MGTTGQLSVDAMPLNKSYRLKSYENIPFRKSIKVGDTEVPRLLDTDKARAEDVNHLIESLSDYADSLEKKFKKMVEVEMRSYWAGIATIFGIFIGIFALIQTSASKIVSNESWSFWKSLSINSSQLIPLTVILVLFVVLLKRTLK